MNENLPKVSVHRTPQHEHGTANQDPNLPVPTSAQIDTINQYLLKRICQAVGRRISELRQKKGLTPAQLALQSNLEEAQLAAIERGERELTLLPLLAIAEQLNTSVHNLLKGIA